VNDDATILLKVAPEVSALDYTNAVTISGYTIPAISTRRADTQVELRDGQSFAISGLLDIGPRYFQQDAGDWRRADSGSIVPVKDSQPLNRGADGDRDPHGY